VRLNLPSPEAVKVAADEMRKQVQGRLPSARIDGFTVQEMVHRPSDHELLAGIADDTTFGPVIVVGQGGTAVEVIADRSIGLPPLNLLLAREMISRTRVAKLLGGYRDRPPADVDAVASTLVKLSELLIACPEVVELDINPLLAGAEGVLALDARVVVRPVEIGQRKLAIQPGDFSCGRSGRRTSLS
jgi:acetyltransferase